MAKQLHDFLSAEQVQAIRAPIEEARTLPREAFTSTDFYELEVEKIYSRHWVAIAFESDLPEQGDVLPVELCGIPLLILRDDKGEIRAFQNIVPYDGCLAVIDPAKGLKEIVTPYHGWTYDLSGKLVAIPYWDGTRAGNLASVAHLEVDLVPVHCDTFLKTVFVNLSADPLPLADHVAPIVRQFEEYDFSKAAPITAADGGVFTLEASTDANWKTVFENACINVLHEHFVHQAYRQSPLHPRISADGVKSYFDIIDDNLLGLGYNYSEFIETYGAVEVPHLGKGDAAPEKSTFATLYPNFYVCIAPHYVEAAWCLPDGVNRTVERRIYLMHRDVVESDETGEQSKSILDLYSGAAVEDGRICESVQKARRSPVYSQKFYSPFWDEMHHRFNQMLVDDLEAD